MLYRGINTGDTTSDDTVPGIDRHLLSNLDVFGLSLSNFDFGLQFGRVGNAREIFPDFHPLADVHRQLLEDATHSGLYMQRLHLI